MLGIPTAYVKKLYKASCGSRGICVKADKSPQVMSLESASVGAEDIGPYFNDLKRTV